MPTLNAMFRLMDGYSSQIKKIVENTDKAANAPPSKRQLCSIRRVDG